MDTLELPVVDATRPAPDPDSGTARGDEPARPDDGRAAASHDRRRWSGRPDARPPLVLRVFVGLAGFGAAIAASALLLSDRAPGAVESLFGQRARELWDRIDASGRVDLPAGSDLPPTDFLVHVAIWTAVAALVGLAVWSWRLLGLSIVVLVGASATLEIAQGRYSTTRVVEAADAWANVLGIVIGSAVAALCYLVWSAAAALGRRLLTR